MGFLAPYCRPHVLQSERLPFGLQGAYFGPSGGVPTSKNLITIVEAEAIQWKSYDKFLPNERLYCVILTLMFCLLRLGTPATTGRWLFDRGSTVHSWPMMPVVLYAPCYVYGVLSLGMLPGQGLSRLRLVCGLFMTLIFIITRRGLYGAFRRKRFLLKTARLRSRRYCAQYSFGQ